MALLDAPSRISADSLLVSWVTVASWRLHHYWEVCACHEPSLQLFRFLMVEVAPYLEGIQTPQRLVPDPIVLYYMTLVLGQHFATGNDNSISTGIRTLLMVLSLPLRERCSNIGH